jgi:hypothetical protein
MSALVSFSGVSDDPHATRLLDGAGTFAQSALRARLDDDPMVYLLHASTALELLAKAYLSSLSGTLIAASGDFDSLLHGSGHSRHARTPLSRMRTITATEALRRVRQLEPEFESGPALQLLAEVRNGIVHAGLFESGADDDLLVPFLRACDFMIGKVPGGSRERMWGDLVGTVDVRLSESAKETELLVADAVASAHLAFEQQFGSMDRAVREAVLTGIERSYDVTKYEQALVDCPGCGRQALTSGSYDVDWEPDYDYADGETYVAGAYPVVTFRPGYLHCRVCDLELDGEEQLEAAGIEKSWHLVDVDPADFYESDDYDDWR